DGELAKGERVHAVACVGARDGNPGANGRRGHLDKGKPFELQVPLKEKLRLQSEWRDQEHQGRAWKQKPEASIAEEGNEKGRGDERQTEYAHTGKNVQPVERRQLLPGAGLPMDDRTAYAGVGEDLREPKRGHG